jgi:hypothetical protein
VTIGRGNRRRLVLQTVKARDCDELAQGLPGWELRFRQLGRGPFRGQLQFLDLGKVQVFWVATNRMTHIEGWPPASTFGCFPVLAANENAVWSGRRLKAGQVRVVEPGREADHVTAAHDYQTVALALDGALVREAAPVLGGCDLEKCLVGRDAVTRGPDYCYALWTDLVSRKPESIGQPVRGVRARILNQADQEVDAKAIGRLCLRSPWTTIKASWIETGDLAFRDAEGDIFLCGRVDDMIVSGGENVYPIELENVLLQHPDVAEAAVVGIADVEFGQRLMAVVAAKKSSTLDSAALVDRLKPRIARYQMPTVIEFCDEFPYTSLGKVDKKVLRR